MEMLSRLPHNDMVLWTVDYLGPFIWTLTFILINYCFMAILLRCDGQPFSRIRNDWLYHILWTAVVPLIYVAFFPFAYETCRDSLSLIRGLIQPNAIVQNLTSCREAFHNSGMVSVVSAPIAVILVFVVWLSVLRKTTKKTLDAWWYNNGRLTLTGQYLFLMSAVVVWSAILFVANFVVDHIFLVRLLSSVNYAALTPTLDNRIDGLRPIQESLVAFMMGWIIAVAIGYFFAWERRRSRAVLDKQGVDVDWLPLTYLMICIGILLIVLVMVFQIHMVLVHHKEYLYHQAVHSSKPDLERLAALYPAWPVDWGLLIGLVPFAFGISGSLHWLMKDFRERVAAQASSSLCENHVTTEGGV